MKSWVLERGGMSVLGVSSEDGGRGGIMGRGRWVWFDEGEWGE
jgi:hypothetical protein